MAGFQVTLHGRFWVTPEVSKPAKTLSVSQLREHLGKVLGRVNEGEDLLHPARVIDQPLHSREAILEILEHNESGEELPPKL